MTDENLEPPKRSEKVGRQGRAEKVGGEGREGRRREGNKTVYCTVLYIVNGINR